MSASTTRTFWFLFLALGFAWGSTYLFIGIAIRTLGPFTLVTSRLAIGTTVLAAVLFASRIPLPREPRTYVDLAILAVLNLVVPFTLTSWGQETIDSGLASVLNATIPLFTVLLVAGLLADERLTRGTVAGVVVGFGGVVVLMAPSLQGGVHGSLGGELALLASSVSYGAANVFVRRRLRGVHAMVTAFFQVAFAFAMTAVLALAFERPFAVRLGADTLVSIAWLGVVASGLAYVGLFRMIEGWGATRTSMIAYLLPVVGVFLGWAVLREVVDARVLAGTALVVAGIAMTSGVSAVRRRGVAHGGSGRGVREGRAGTADEAV